MTEISTPPNTGHRATGQPGQTRPTQQAPQTRGSASAQSHGRLAPARKPLFRS